MKLYNASEKAVLDLAFWHRALNSKIDPLNIAIRDGELDKAFLLALEILRAADKVMGKLNDIRYRS